MKKHLFFFLLAVSVLLLVFSCSYEDDPVVAVLVANPAAGYCFPELGGEVKLTCATTGVIIYYTTEDGELDQTYSGNIIVTENVTIRAVAKAKFWRDSELLTVSYTVMVSTPTASPTGGYIFPAEGGEIELSCATEGAAIYYTTGLGEPDQLYTDPISVTADTTIKALAKKDGMADSAVLTADYIVDDDE
jgi:hypothetical protein